MIHKTFIPEQLTVKAQQTLLGGGNFFFPAEFKSETNVSIRLPVFELSKGEQNLEPKTGSAIAPERLI